jgi:hypothetical protein
VVGSLLLSAAARDPGWIAPLALDSGLLTLVLRNDRSERWWSGSFDACAAKRPPTQRELRMVTPISAAVLVQEARSSRAWAVGDSGSAA